jgi:acetolactate synthase I/II/III large subunit
VHTTASVLPRGTRPPTREQGTDVPPTAARALVATLRAHETDRVFCVAGESYLPVLDALYDTPLIDVVTCRHEGSAGFMALADAKLTGRAGVCLVSRGPGATNASIAVHAAAEDATPLILLVGGVGSRVTDCEAFQDIDCGRLFGGIAKACWTVRDPGRVGEFVARAFRVAESATPGPVVLALPADMLGQACPGDTPAQRVAPARLTVAGPDLEAVRGLLAAARRPLVLAGGRLDTPAGRVLLRDAAQQHSLPVVTANKYQHLLPNRHASYAGHLSNSTQADQLVALGQADLILAIGTRLDSVTTQRDRFPAPRPGQPLIHVYPDAARLGARHQAACGLAMDPVPFLEELSCWPAADPGGTRRAWVTHLHQIEAARSAWHPVHAEDGVVFGSVVASLDELTGGDVTIVVDSGTFTSWIYRYMRFGARGRLLGISSSSMGFGVGAGVSAALRADDVPTVVVTGDGGFLMNPGELMTACSRGLPVVYVIANNGSYATIRQHQERAYPGRQIGTDLANPDFAAMAEAFGALGLTARTDQEVRACLATALDCDRPTVIDVHTSLRYITAWQLLGGQGSAGVTTSPVR